MYSRLTHTRTPLQVTGDTLYNLVQFNEIPTDKEDRPLNPVPHITRTEVLQNPFDDIVPRGGSGGSLERKTEDIKSQSRATKYKPFPSSSSPL